MENLRAGDNTVGPEAARGALHQAEQAKAAGAQRAVRPWCYYPALGGCLALAFASFSLGAVAPVVAAFVVLVLVVSTLAQRATGAVPYRSYLSPATRGSSITFVIITAALFVLGLILERAAELTGAMIACGLAVMVVTVILGRRVDRASAEQRVHWERG